MGQACAMLDGRVNRTSMDIRKIPGRAVWYGIALATWLLAGWLGIAHAQNRDLYAEARARLV